MYTVHVFLITQSLFFIVYLFLLLGIQNRKILEDLELKKQILLKTGAVPTPPTISHSTTPVCYHFLIN